VNTRAAFFIFILALGVPASALADYADELIEKSDALKLDSTPKWIKLVHYHRDLLGGYTGEADGMKFYTSPIGRSNPKAELQSTIRAFFAPDQPDTRESTHPQCQFPARFAWLKEKLGFDSKRLPEKSCPRFEEFHKRLRGKAVTFIFSSYYLNNPSSTFGHTFIRINKTENDSSQKSKQKYDLLNFGIGYAADANVTNPLLYAIYGLAGLFPGTFTSLPYFYKVREYNDAESRDLWEYDLGLTPEETDFLVRHLWELGWTHFNYFYLTKNCSYHILATLDAARPELNLVHNLAYYVIPSDTVKVVYNTPGLVTAIHYRPSIRTVLATRLKSFSPEEKNLLKRIVNEKNVDILPQEAPTAQKVKILDAAIDHVDYKYNKALVFEEPGPSKWKRKLLMVRASLGVPSKEVIVPLPEEQAPQKAHPSSRTGLNLGKSSAGENFYSGNIRFALHDLADPPVGYPRSQIEFLNQVVRYNESDKSLWLEDWAIFRVTSLSELDTFQHAPSWRVRLGATTVRDEGCAHCLAGILEGGPGLTLRLGAFSFYSFADIELSGTPNFSQHPFRLGGGPALGFMLELSDRLAMHAEGGRRFFLAPHNGYDSYLTRSELRWSFAPALAFNLEYRAFQGVSESLAGLFLYF